MKNKVAWIVSVVAVIIVVSLFYAKSVDENSWVCTDAGWIQHGKPSQMHPAVPCGNEEHLAVENYLKTNISNISPEKEVLGGKFYITKIDWTGANSGAVEYEDGHIALKASFDYEIQKIIDSAGYVVTIENYKIIK